MAFLGCTFLGHSGAAEPPASDPEPGGDNAPAEEDVVRGEHEPVAVADVSAVVVAKPRIVPEPTPRPAVEIAPDLLAFAARVASDHERQHGRPIDIATLRQRLGVAPLLAEAVHERLKQPATAAT